MLETGVATCWPKYSDLTLRGSSTDELPGIVDIALVCLSMSSPPIIKNYLVPSNSMS